MSCSRCASEQVIAIAGMRIQATQRVRRAIILYHYTDAKGLEGIITKKVIWASDYRFLNDANELNYGLMISSRNGEHTTAEWVMQSGLMLSG